MYVGEPQKHNSTLLFSQDLFFPEAKKLKATLTIPLLEQQQVNHVDESLHHVMSWGDAHYVLSPKKQ